MAIERHGCMYRNTEGYDQRWHTDVDVIEGLRKSVPPYWQDTCPECGNKQSISGCRCVVNHRTCPECGFSWYWKVHKWKGVLEIIPS